jgi:hypothetical protein
LPAYKLVTLSLWEGFSLNEAVYFLVLLVLLALILTLYVDCWLLVSRYRLLFQQADGKPALLSFRFRSPKVGERFSEQVEYHRRQAQGRPGAKPTSKQPPLKSPRLPGQGT